ncbi:MAG TPA: chemotaxis protein CheW [bacterium]
MVLKRRSERRATVRPENATVRIVTFRVGPELYGLEISGVREIDRMRPVTRVPQALSFVEGVIHLRGEIIPVIDLARRFGIGALEADKRTRIVIATLRGQHVGLIVTAVTEVLPIAASAIGAPPQLTFEAGARYISGMARVKEELISILDLDRLLSTEEFAQLQQQSLV